MEREIFLIKLKKENYLCKKLQINLIQKTKTKTKNS